MEDLERLVRRVQVNLITGCWIWQGYCNKGGYGITSYQGTQWKTHRLLYHLMKGIKNPTNEILHSCDNPPCVNPDHLREGSHRENIQEAWDRGRIKPKYKVSDTEIQAILDDYAITKSGNATARRLGRSTSYVWRVLNNKLKRQVPVG